MYLLEEDVRFVGMEETIRVATEGSLVQGETGKWEVVIGLEVHAQVVSKTKLFSRGSVGFGGDPNTQVSLVDAAMPGMLPVLNEECVRQAVRTGLGLRARINFFSVFERKHYFYPDLPQGYQISQYEHPIVGEGEIFIDMPDGEVAPIRIERLHLEQDAGKLMHDACGSDSYVDLNRSGIALMEIVSKPDIRSAEEAKAYLMKLRTILRYLGTCDGNMDRGSLRADVNLSVHKPGTPFGTPCEIKNVNSAKFIGQAIEYETLRQIELLENGEEIRRETRLFDSSSGETRFMRIKEDVSDYRYFPDPDLLPVKLTTSYVENLASSLPELPDEKKERLIREYGLTSYDSGILVADQESADFFEEVARGRDGKMAANWIINELFGRLNKAGLHISESPVSSKQLAAILDLIHDGVLSGKIAKDLFEIVWSEGGDPVALVESRGMKQLTDLSEIEKFVSAILSANPEKVAQAQQKPNLLGWFVGQVISASGGKANPQVVRDLLEKKFADL